MKITAKVIKDSVYKSHRLTTLELEYPRYIHAEFMTHRVFSRNASSSRAIPVEKLIAQCETDWVEPIFLYNQKGMAATEYLEEDDLDEASYLWRQAMTEAVHSAKLLANLGVHKQIVNRLLEPFITITTLVSATEWDNFFKLRMHPAAQQEIQTLATRIFDARNESTPAKIDIGHWHLPYIQECEEGLDLEVLRKVSAARCARVSYLNHGAKNTIDEDIMLADRLIEAGHYSPLEHVASPSPFESSGNFNGYIQMRHL
jgi:thymidylate synthase ThyX